MTEDIQFFQRRFPSANMILLRGERPLLFDSGFGSDAQETVALLHEAGVAPGQLQSVVNSHYHCDHVGGNHHLQTQYGVPIAAHIWEATMINRRDREACSALWLDQPIEPYTVTRALADGDALHTGRREWLVLHTPGHTLGHISLYSDGVLLTGDVIHADDVAWVNPFREGASAIYRMLETLDKLAHLPLQRAYSGHGALTADPITRLDAARRRYEKWLREPQKIGWHATKRIFTYALMLTDGLTEPEIAPYLLRCPWFLDYSRHIFESEPAAFVQPFMAEILRSGAAHWDNGRLLPAAPYATLDPAWLRSVPKPGDWPAAE